MSSGDEMTRSSGNPNWITDKGHYRAGILEGLRMAAKIVASQSNVGFDAFKDNPWFQGHESAVKRIASAIEARGKEMGA